MTPSDPEPETCVCITTGDFDALCRDREALRMLARSEAGEGDAVIVTACVLLSAPVWVLAGVLVWWCCG